MTAIGANQTNLVSGPTARFRSRAKRRAKDRIFVGVCIVAASVSMLALVALLTSILSQAFGFTFESALLGLLFGVVVSTTGTSAITLPVLLPSVIAGRASRKRKIVALVAGIVLVSSVLALIALSQARTGRSWLTWQFITSVPSRFPEMTGIWPALIGTIMTAAVCALSAVPVGVATAVLLEEFRPRRRLLRKAHGFVQLNITNLAGVPSIVYGILGLTAFVQMFGAFGTPIDPAFTLGVKWSDQFFTENGETLVVPVADPSSPISSPRDVTQWRNEAGEIVDVRILERESVAGDLAAADEAIDAIENALEARIESLPALDAASVEAAVEAVWKESSLQSRDEAAWEKVAAIILEAGEPTGREARRAMRQAIDEVERAEMKARFPGVLFADAVPSRVANTKPWYFRLPIGRSVLAGGLTLMLVVLPIIIIASQEALRAVPRSMRHASLALGATPWQTVRRTTLPAAMPGIMTGVILAMSRAIGEAAPILVIAGIVYITFIPHHLMDDFTVMPLQIYNWASQPQEEFHFVAAAGIILLMTVLLFFNAAAILIRQRTQKQFS